MTLKFASKGDVINCPNSHPCLQVTKDIYVGDRAMADSFMAIPPMVPPVENEPIGWCPHCKLTLVMNTKFITRKYNA